jgi:hypothetical protein
MAIRQLGLRAALMGSLAFAAVMPGPPVVADIPVIDLASITEQITAFLTQVKQWVAEIGTWINTNIISAADLRMLTEDINMVITLTDLTVNFVHHPSFGALLGLMNLAGLNLTFADPTMMISLLSGRAGGLGSVTGALTSVAGMTSGLAGFISNAQSLNSIYVCPDNTFACQLDQVRANKNAATMGMLGKLLDDIATHVTVNSGIRDRAGLTTDPKGAMDLTVQGVTETNWNVAQLAQVMATYGMGWAAQQSVELQAHEKERSDYAGFLHAAGH